MTRLVQNSYYHDDEALIAAFSKVANAEMVLKGLPPRTRLKFKFMPPGTRVRS